MSKTYFNISDKLRLYEFDGMLDQYGDAAAAYSLRKLRNGYTGNAIRVRRSSDNTERDMGFYDNELDTVALLEWVNEEYTFIEEPFDGAYTWNVALGSASVNGGVLDFPDGVNTVVYTSIGNTLKTQQVRVTFTILNYQSGSIKFQNYNSGADGTNRTADGTYTEILTISESGNNNFGFSGTLQGQIDDFKIEQLTADGHVHTWYDQSANANHAVQGTESAQPKIVDAGSLVTENGKPGISFDGTDDKIITSAGLSPGISVASFFWTGSVNGFDSAIFGARPADVADGLGFYLQSYRYRINNEKWGSNSHFATIPNTPILISFVIIDGVSNLYENSIGIDNPKDFLVDNPVFSGPSNVIGSNVGDSYFDGIMQDFILYHTDKTNNRENIETNINTYYNIY